MSFLELDPTLLAILGATVMGVTQAVKPFIPEQYVMIALGGFSAVMGLLMSFSMEVSGIATFLVQTIANSYFILVGAVGPYNIAKSINTKEETPKGL